MASAIKLKNKGRKSLINKLNENKIMLINEKTLLTPVAL